MMDCYRNIDNFTEEIAGKDKNQLPYITNLIIVFFPY